MEAASNSSKQLREISRHVIGGVGCVTMNGIWHELKAGDGVHIPPGTSFAWDGEFRMVMSCAPPFDPKQYEIIKIKEEVS